MTIGLGTLGLPAPEVEQLLAALVARNGLHIQRSAEAGVMVGVTDPGSARAISERLLDRAGIGP